MHCNTPGFHIHHQLLKLTKTHVHWVSDAIQPSHPLLLLPSIYPSIRVFSNESVLCIRCQSVGVSASASVLPMNIQDQFLLLLMVWSPCIQVTLKSLLQQDNSKTSILQCSAFFMVQLSHPCMTTGKPIALILQTLLVKQYLCFLICCLGWL